MRTGIATWARVIWDWTLGGLPGWLVLPGFLGNKSQPFYVDRWPIKADDIPKRAVLDICLGPELFLEKQLTLPVAVRANLSKAIDLNMRQSLPAGGAELL